MRRALPAFALAIAVSFLLGMLAGTTRPGTAGRGVETPVARAQLPPLEVQGTVPASAPAAPLLVAGPDFSDVAARLNPAIVSVETSAREVETGSRLVNPRRGDEGQDGAGSGFIIDPTGYILTNHHVVSDAERVTVTLSDGRVLKATVVGVDPAIDVALLKVNVPESLPTARLGSSSALRVGEWVCAIGNPLGFVHSVTVGVVSFLGRKVFDQSLDALIQTDAGITFGNSGGPLINARGDVVGITTAVSWQAANIGFAVPIDQVMTVLPQLRETGRVARGYLGVGLTSVTPALQRALALSSPRGALIQDVTADTPAERAGLRPYDVVLAVDGHAVASDDELSRYVAGRQPGTLAALDVSREGRRLTVPIKLMERPLPRSARRTMGDSDRARMAAGGDQRLGLTVIDLTEATARRKNIPDVLTGVVLTAIDAAGPTRITSMRPGQILLEINRQPVESAAAFRAIVASLRPGAPVALYVYDPIARQRLLHTVVTDPDS